MVVIAFNLADARDPNDPQGRSYRQVNAAMVHAYSVGTLVELDNGERLYVMRQTRDCDQTPMYSLGLKNSEERTWLHGHPEWSVGIVEVLI